MRRVLFALIGLAGLYGCYDYTIPNEPAEPKAETPAKSKADETSSSDPLTPASSTPTKGDAPVTTPGATSTSSSSEDAGTDAAPLSCAPIKCANGCVSGACNPPTKCVTGGTYCGGDKVNGDPNVLYKCGADGFATTVQQSCTNGCIVAPPGQDDYCK